MKKGVNLGCGKQHKPSNGQMKWVNIDWIEPADIVCDVTKGLPFKDEEIDRIEADNLLEHFDNDEFKFVMNECYRVLKKGGVFWWKSPDANNWPDGAWGDPTHKRYFFPRSFYYFDVNHPTWFHYGKEYGFKGWQVKVTTDKKFFTCELTKPQ